MTLTNLTAEQVWLLNNLWNIQTMEELRAWQSTLPERQFKLVDSLIEMLRLEEIEERIEVSDFFESDDVLRKFLKTK